MNLHWRLNYPRFKKSHIFLLMLGILHIRILVWVYLDLIVECNWSVKSILVLLLFLIIRLRGAMISLVWWWSLFSWSMTMVMFSLLLMWRLFLRRFSALTLLSYLLYWTRYDWLLFLWEDVRSYWSDALVEFLEGYLWITI